METEQARHVTEESLIHTQPSLIHQETAKLQNGNQSPDISPKQLNGGNSWRKAVKLHNDCSSPVSMYDQGLYKINGAVKHILNEHSLVTLPQPKKSCVRSETTGPWEQKQTNKEVCLDRITDMNKPENCPNGDIFALSSYKQVQISNGASLMQPSVESTAGEQTQYCPNHMSKSHETSNLHMEIMSSPSVTSGCLAQLPNNEPLAITPSEVQRSNDTEFLLIGYSGNFGLKQKHQPLPYPFTDLQVLENKPQSDLGKEPEICSTVSISNRAQAQNDTRCSAPNKKGNEPEIKPTPLDQDGNVALDTQMGWTNLKSTPTLQHQANQSSIWRDFPLNKNTEIPIQGNLLNADTLQSLEMQPSFPMQHGDHIQNEYKQHTNAATRYQTPTTKTFPDLHNQSNTQINSFQSQQYTNEQSFLNVKQNQLNKNDQKSKQDQTDFMHQQSSQPQQLYEAHQKEATTIMDHGEQGIKIVSQLQNPNHGSLRCTTEGYTNTEISPPTYRQHNPMGKEQNGFNSSTQMAFMFPNQVLSNSQPVPDETSAIFGFRGAEEMPHRQYNPSPIGQHSQNSCKHMLPRDMKYQHSKHARMQQPTQDATDRRKVSPQMYPKAESSDSFFQLEQETPPGLGAKEDFQRHAALQMHLLQRQESCPHSLKANLPLVKCENNRMVPPQMQQDRNLTRNMLETLKQERTSLPCSQSKHKNILATMEQQLQQYQPSLVFDRKSLAIKSPNKLKVEMTGNVAVISTNIEGSNGDQCKLPASTPKKEPGIQSFLESPIKLLETPIKNLLDTPIKTQYEIPPCHCLEQISEKDEGPYYTHLGAAPNIKGIREKMQDRSGLTGSAIRIEKVVYTGKEGKSTQGCPIAKWVIRRANVDEKILVLVRERAGHTCETSCIVVVILIWEGIPTTTADRLYMELSNTLTKHGALTNRRCALNEERTCACQGRESNACGASFSFGCSWSMYYNGCKFARSKVPRKFKLLGDDPMEEEKLEKNLQALATVMAPLYKKMAPDAYSNQVEHEHRAPHCRLGFKEGRPFSGVTACLDFCAHAHRDLHNMPGGSTVVCTLTREDNREIGKIPEDEQLHVLPLYKAASTDEFGSAEAQLEKTKTGAIQVLSTFRRQVRMLAEPAKSCRQRKLEGKKGGANKTSYHNTSKVDSTQLSKQQKQSSCDAIGHNKTGAGAYQNHMGTPFLPGQNALAAQNKPQPQNYQSQSSTSLLFSNPTSSGNYPKYPNTPESLSSTSKLSMFPHSTNTGSSYHSSVPVPNSYINGSNTASPFPSAVTPNNLYPGYQCNGSIPIDNYHPYYPNHLDIYKQQRPSLYSDQQFNPQQHYGLNYPPPYGEPGLPIDGYGNGYGHYPGYSSIGGQNTQFLEAFSKSSLAHTQLDYATNKCNQFGKYPNPYLGRNHQLFSQNTNPLNMQKTEINLHGSNSFPQVLSYVGSEGINSTQPPGLNLLNGNNASSLVKQEAENGTLATQEEDAWSDNEHNFLDPDIGGVAVAPSHGSILIECAKRELHATTPLKKPDRTHPTRISLVFYQHKNLNEAKHGLALWEAKMAEKAREKEEDAEKHGIDGTPSKSVGKRSKKENPEPPEPSEPSYKRFVQMLAENSLSSTTNTYVSSTPYAFTKVTGPYSHFL